jgi:hypothetical protein
MEGWATPIEQPSARRLTAALNQIFGIKTPRKSICGTGIDQASNGRYVIRRKTAAACVFANRFLVWRQIDTIDFIAGDVGVEPFDFRSHILQHAYRLSGNCLQFGIRQIARAWNFPLDYVLGHGYLTKRSW